MYHVDHKAHNKFFLTLQNNKKTTKHITQKKNARQTKKVKQNIQNKKQNKNKNKNNIYREQTNLFNKIYLANKNIGNHFSC